jgi:hypothetical protein
MNTSQQVKDELAIYYKLYRQKNKDKVKEYVRKSQAKAKETKPPKILTEAEQEEKKARQRINSAKYREKKQADKLKQEEEYKFTGNKDVSKIIVLCDDSSSSSSSGTTGSELTDDPSDE